jgi:hypothetical protein
MTTDTSRERPRRCRARLVGVLSLTLRRDWIPPLLAVAAFLVLVAANVNGSSIGLFAEDNGSDPALVAGTPRAIRGDEFLFTTPIAVSAVRQGFPENPYIGLTPTSQLAIAHGAPTRSWLETFKPQDWGYLVLGEARGLAFHWWMPFLVCLVGLFLLFRAVAVNRWLAAALAVVGTMTPYNAWWSAPAPGLVLGYGALAGATAVVGMRVRRGLLSFGCGMAAGASATAMFLVLYPPWLVSVGIVVAAVVAGYAADHRPGWLRLSLVAAGSMAVTVPVLLAWYAANRTAIRATVGTIYPGNRISQSGGAEPAHLLSAPLNPLLSRGAGATLDETNLSEVSSTWLPLPVLAVALAVFVLRRTRQGHAMPAGGDAEPGGGCGDHGRRGWTVAAVTAAMCVLTAWALLPLPTWAGTLLLERVPGHRLPLALGFASILLVGLVGAPRRGTRLPWWEAALWTVAVAATVWLTLEASQQLPVHPGELPTLPVLLLGAVVAVGFALLAAGRLSRLVAAGLAAYALWSWGTVNPLYHGLGALDDNPVTRVMRPIAQDSPGVRVQVFGSHRLVAVVRASGVQSLSGVTFYPNTPLMRTIAPGEEEFWNSFRRYNWAADRAAAPVAFRPLRGTALILRVDPCAPEILALDPGWAVSQSRLSFPCLQPFDEARYGEGKVFFYRVNR